MSVLASLKSSATLGRFSARLCSKQRAASARKTFTRTGSVSMSGHVRVYLCVRVCVCVSVCVVSPALCTALFHLTRLTGRRCNAVRRKTALGAGRVPRRPPDHPGRPPGQRRLCRRKGPAGCRANFTPLPVSPTAPPQAAIASKRE